MAKDEHVYVMQGDLLQRYLASMKDYRSVQTHATIAAIQMKVNFAVVQEGDAPITGRMNCKAGVWLVKNYQGAVYPVPDDVFRRQYEEIPDHEHIEGVTRH